MSTIQGTYRQRAKLAARQKTIKFLGGKCVDCGMTDWRALHINFQGKRRNWNWLLARVREDRTGYEVRCANCGSIKSVNEITMAGTQTLQATRREKMANESICHDLRVYLSPNARPLTDVVRYLAAAFEMSIKAAYVQVARFERVGLVKKETPGGIHNNKQVVWVG